MRNPKILVLDRADGLAEQIRGVPDDSRPRPARAPRPGRPRLEVLPDGLPAMSVLLAFNRRPEARLRDIVRTGAIDLLQLPAKDDDLLESVQRAIELSSHQQVAA